MVSLVYPMFIDKIEIEGYENVYNFHDDEFFAYIAIHSTKLGPALGGCRVRQYASNEAALADALKLSKGMTYKSSAAGLDFGGGKAVINTWNPTRDIMLKVGEAVETFGGSYITAEDYGTSAADMAIVAEQTSYVLLTDASYWTALGIFECINAVRTFSYLDETQLHVWVQGLGKVGWELAKLLHNAGYFLYVSDIIAERVEAAQKEFMARPYYEQFSDIDIYAPCALGGIVNADNIPRIEPIINRSQIENHRIDFPIICGSANNQLTDEDTGPRGMAQILQSYGILYCPDFLINSGGVIAGAAEITGTGEQKLNADVCALGKVLLNAIDIGKRNCRSPLWGAMWLANSRL